MGVLIPVAYALATDKYGLPPANGMVEKKKVIVSTKVTIARSGSPSVRTTIPLVIAQMLGLEDGSYLDWQFEPEGGSFAVSVKKGSR